MITGTVTDDREIVIRFELVAADLSTVSIKAVVDTGFNGFVTLPTNMLNTLRASPAGTRRAELGDGKVVDMAVYLVKVKWREEERDVLALEADATPLIGMSLLWGSRVVFDAQDNGAVTIDTIP